MKRKQKILITSTNFNVDISPYKDKFNFVFNDTGDTLNEIALKGYLDGVDGVVASLELYSSEMLKKFRKTLKIISRIGSGTDNIDLNAAEQYGITIATTPNAPIKAVAELTIAMMINLCRQLPLLNDELHTGNWNPRLGYKLSERNIGILGKGRIGSLVANLLIPFTSKPIKCYDVIYERSNCELRDMFSTCDLITLHIPLEKNYEFVDRRLIELMPNDSYLINTSRGKVVKESDVIEALKSGKLAGYAADVHSEEPYSGPLINFPNVILTPHIGAHTIETRKEMNELALKKCMDFLSK